MAYTTIVFENPNTGHIKEAPVGFSWTVFFFGCFPPLFRSDWKWFFIMFILIWITVGLSSVVFMFIYNKLYIKELVSSGFKAKSIATGSFDEVNTKLGIKLPLFEDK